MQSTAYLELIGPIQGPRRILWLALTATIPIYLAVAYKLFGSAPSPADPLSHPLTLPLAMLALLTAAASRRIPNLMLPEQRTREILAEEPDLESLSKNPQTGAVDPDRLRRITLLSPHEQRLLVLAGESITPFLVRLAMHEAIAIYGLVLAILSKNFPAMLPFAVTALILNLMVYPKSEPSFTPPG